MCAQKKEHSTVVDCCCCLYKTRFSEPLQWQLSFMRLDKSFKGVHAATFHKVKVNSNGYCKTLVTVIN